MQPDLLDYYNARAREYERVYDKPERQDDLRKLHLLIPSLFVGRHVMDVACGTGYWTRRISATAASVTGCDLASETLTVARLQQPPGHLATYVIGHAYALQEVVGDFDAAFTGFWWSHVRLEKLAEFLAGLHQRLSAASKVVVVDNRYVPGSNWPITRTDAQGNTFQLRTLENGDAHEVLKNFPKAADVRSTLLAAGAINPEVLELKYFWCATYETG
ncbi:MAG: class I SAM-dependent methyltransferase [Phycisphaerae bacterium]|nr:class I SAM-dependent methyltransferase [Gemmatimonadaceae bacterium]